MKTLLWNITVSISSVWLGLAVAAGLMSLGTPGFAAGVVGTLVYVTGLMANVR